MKKVFLFLFLLLAVGWVYYLWGNRKSFFRKAEVHTDYTERVRLEGELDSLQKKYDYLVQICSDESKMNLEVKRLRSENSELRRELDALRTSPKAAPTASQTIKPKKSDEKNLPIARNGAAVELQKFLTELYGDR